MKKLGVEKNLRCLPGCVSIQKGFPMREKFDEILLFSLLIVLTICFNSQSSDVVYGQESKAIAQVQPDEKEDKSLAKKISEQIPKLKEMSSEELSVLVNQLQELNRKREETAALSDFCNQVVSHPDQAKAMLLASQIQFIEVLISPPKYWLMNHTEKQELFTQAYNSVEFILIAADRISLKKEKLPEDPQLPIFNINNAVGLSPKKYQELERKNKKAIQQQRQIREFNNLQDDYLPAATKAMAACLIFDDEKKSIMKSIMSRPSVSDEFRKQIMAQRAKYIVSINKYKMKHGTPIFEVK